MYFFVVQIFPALAIGCACLSLVTQLCPTFCGSMTASSQALLSMGFSRQEYWSG